MAMTTAIATMVKVRVSMVPSLKALAFGKDGTPGRKEKPAAFSQLGIITGPETFADETRRGTQVHRHARAHIVLGATFDCLHDGTIIQRCTIPTAKRYVGREQRQ